MDPRKKLKNFINPHYVTGVIIAGMLKVTRLLTLDLSKYVLKKLSGRFRGLPDPFGLPRRYKITSLILATLGTIFAWGFVVGLFSSSCGALALIGYLFASILFYSLSIIVIFLYTRKTKHLIYQITRLLKGLINKSKKIYKIWFP